MKKIIIDCDPGIDDFVTLVMANTLEDVDILGITTVLGNNTIDQCTANALNIVDYLGMDIAVYKGAEKPLYGELVTATGIHGESGLRSIILKQSKSFAKETVAHQFLSKTIMDNPNEVDILAIGPLTNVAKMLITYPQTAKLVHQITIMGGAHKHGNVTPSAEFNIFADPEAAKIVFESGANIKLIPLDATMSEGLSAEEIESLFNGSLTEKQKVFKQALNECLSIANGFGLTEAYLHDPLTLFAMLNEDHIHGESYFVDVDFLGELTRGKTIVDVMNTHKKEKNVYFADSYNKEAFVDFIKKCVKYYE